MPPGLATLPPTIPWHGTTIYTPPAGAGSRLIGLGPDDTLYVLLARSLPVPTPTPSNLFVVPDVQASVIALRPDGSIRSGWPSAGVPVSGYPISYKVNADGTVFVASGANPYGGQPNSLSQLTITAIGSDGKVLAGWPYRTPAAQPAADPELLALGPGGVVCLVTVKPGVTTLGSGVPMVIYCLGRDGKLLPGWPYSSQLPLFNLAVGPDGTVYAAQVTSTKTTANSSAFPYQVLAIAPDGKPKPGWTTWSRDGADDITAIMPTKDGRVYLVMGGDSGQAELIDLDRSGKALDDHVELAASLRHPSYKDAVLTSDGSLFVTVTDQAGDANLVNAYSADGSQMPGWPQLIGGWGDLAVAPQGSVWVAWTLYAASGGGADTSVVALFDKNGKLQPGYPMAADNLPHYKSYGLEVASDGTAYASAATISGSRIVALRP